MLVIQLPQWIEGKLERVAKRTGKSKASLAREAVMSRIEDLEDIYLAEQVLERIPKGEERTLPINRVRGRSR